MSTDEDRAYHLEIFLSEEDVSEEVKNEIPASGVRREILEDIVSEIGKDVEVSRRTTEQLAPGTETAIALGSLVVSSATLLFQVYKYLQEREDVDSGAVSTEDGESVYIEDNADVELIQLAGGKIIKDVEGDVTIYEISAEAALELNKMRQEFQEKNSKKEE